MPQQKQLSKVNNIRAIAILVVVLGHSIILYSSSWNYYETAVSSLFLDELKNMINIFQMPLFFSLSGFLFLYTHQKEESFLMIVRKKVKRLLVPYIGIGLVYLVPIRLAVGYSGYRNLNIWGIFKNLITCGDVGHLWYLPTLFCILLISELLLRLLHGLKSEIYQSFLICAITLALYAVGQKIETSLFHNIYIYIMVLFWLFS